MVPVGSQLSGALRVTVVARRTTTPPSLAIPPAAEAVLRVIRLPRMSRWPWLARPPPVAAEFPDTVLPMTVALPPGGVAQPAAVPRGGVPRDHAVAHRQHAGARHPSHGGQVADAAADAGLPALSLGAVLPVIRLPAIVIVPWFKMPAPIPPGAALPVIELDLMTARPPL